MIIPQFHLNAVPVDSQQHRQTRVRVPVSDWSHVAGMNALFLTATECMNAATDYPIVFVQSGQDGQGQPDYAPIAVFGLRQGENLYVENSRWRVIQLPALMAVYPFCIARTEGSDRFAVCLDMGSPAVSQEGDGQRLFNDAGEPTEFANQVLAQLERMEAHTQGTRKIMRRLADLGLLQQKRFDATLPDGQKLAVDGFFMIDEDKVKALPDATVLELHREGLYTFIQAHWVSLGHMRRLLAWRIGRETSKP
jgi:SapC